MSQEPNDNSTELRRIVRMLEKTASMAEHASLTGSMGGGKEFAARSYNSVVEHLASMGEVPAGLFPPLPPDASLDAAGIASAQLAEYLRAGLPEPEQQQGGPGLGNGNIIVNMGGLSEIGEMVREHLPEWLRGKRSKPEPESSMAERTESSEAAPSNSQPSAQTGSEPPHVARLSLPTQQARIEELRPGRQEETPR